MIYLITSLVFISVFIISTYILEKLFIMKYTQRLLSGSDVPSKHLPAKLSLAIIPKGRIFRDISLPIPGKDGQEIQIGTLIVTRSGVFILCQICGSGILENPTSSKWKMIENGKFTEFDNPFEAQKDARALIDYYVKTGGVTGVNVHTAVIYTSGALRFTHPKPRGVILADDFLKKLTQLERHGKLSSAQLRAVCGALRSADAY